MHSRMVDTAPEMACTRSSRESRAFFASGLGLAGRVPLTERLRTEEAGSLVRAELSERPQLSRLQWSSAKMPESFRRATGGARRVAARGSGGMASEEGGGGHSRDVRNQSAKWLMASGNVGRRSPATRWPALRARRRAQWKAAEISPILSGSCRATARAKLRA